MINTSDKLMALLDQELNRMEEEEDEFSDLEDMGHHANADGGLGHNNGVKESDGRRAT